ncbi:hypothetical protein Q3G72_014050 [Acer saccharum]|nr:hypothetical protein Q3G72_014050 [Acer saccharum]
MDKAVEDLKHALVLKFLSSRPLIDVLRVQIIKTWGFSKVPMISFMDNHHVLLHLANEKDYIHAWAREGRVVAGCQFRLFNWSANFDVNKESSIVPQWIFLLNLPLHLYRLDCYRVLLLDLVDSLGLIMPRYIVREPQGLECDKPIRKEGWRREREEKVWKEVGRKGSLGTGDELTRVVAKDQRHIGFTREKEFESLGVENLQLAVSVEESEIVLNVSKDSEIVLNVRKDIVNGQVETGGCLGSKNNNEASDEGKSVGEVVIVEEVKDVEEEVEGVVCGNSFAVLSDGNNDWFNSCDFCLCQMLTAGAKSPLGLAAWVGSRPRNSSSVAEFNECISRCRLLDLRFEGRRLSWCNGHQGLSRSWANLDRVLINNDFVVKYGEAKALLLNRNTSDHSLILLHIVVDLERYGLTPFRFQNMWTSHVGFLDVVGNSWSEPMVFDSCLHCLVGKLKRMKQRLRVWNKEIFGRVDGFTRELEERVERHEEMLQAEYSESVEEEFLVSKMELDVWYKREEMILA